MLTVRHDGRREFGMIKDTGRPSKAMWARTQKRSLVMACVLSASPNIFLIPKVEQQQLLTPEREATLAATRSSGRFFQWPEPPTVEFRDGDDIPPACCIGFNPVPDTQRLSSLDGLCHVKAQGVAGGIFQHEIILLHLQNRAA